MITICFLIYLYIISTNGFDMTQDEDEIRTRNHKTRLAKVELYLEVPTTDGDKVYGEYGTLDLIERILHSSGIETTGPGEINLSPIFDDDINNYKNPVGYLAPDGKFYVIESSENGLAHLEISRVVYAKYIGTQYMPHGRYGVSFEDTLDKNGFIKVHEKDIRYHVHIPLNPYSDNPNYSPDPTQEQIDALIDYVRRFHWSHYSERLVFVNEREYEVDTFIKIMRSGDKLAIRKVFEL